MKKTAKTKEPEIQAGFLLQPTCGQGDLSTEEIYVVIDVTGTIATPKSGMDETSFMLLGTIDEQQRIIPRIIGYRQRDFKIVGRIDTHFDCEPRHH